MSYEGGKIYKIVCLNTGLQYIGSTRQTLKQRLSDHVEDYYRWKYRKRHFVSSYKIIQNGNFKIELVLEYPCSNKRELEIKEREYIESMECVNLNVPTRTTKEYYQDNKKYLLETQKEYKKGYRKRDYVKEKQKEYMKERIKCPTCNKQMSRGSLYLHNKIQHKAS